MKLFFIGCLFLLFFGSCDKSSKPVQQEYITIGGLFPLTGEFCNEGIRALSGLQLARQVINENGGVLGKPIDIIILDDKNDVQHAVEQYKILKAKGVVAIVGSSFPEVTQALAKETQKDGMPFVAPTAINPTKAKVLAEFAHNKLGAKTALIIGDYQRDSITILFEESFKNIGGSIIGRDNYSSYGDFETILAKYKINQPDIIFCQTHYIAAAKLVETAHKMGFDKSKFIGTYAWEGILGFLREYSVIDRIYYATPFTLDEMDSIVKDFSQRFFINYNQMPLSTSALSYSAIQVLVDAIESSESTEPENIIAAMKINMPEIVAKHNPQAVYIMQIKNNLYSLYEKIDL